MALDQAAQASKAKSEFLASMSHELRTPLNAVIGFSDAMVMEIFGPMSERYKNYAADIRSSGAHLLSLINDVLDLTRLDAGQAELREEVFGLPELVGESLRMVDSQAQKADIALSTDIADGLPALKADKRRIKQVLVNLLSNAVKFTPLGRRGDAFRPAHRKRAWRWRSPIAASASRRRTFPRPWKCSARSIPPWRANMRAPAWACPCPSN